MKEIGEYLKSLRISQGVTTLEASEDLNVKYEDLENLEDGVSRAFKDIFILRELIRSYAKYLGADVSKVMDDFNDFLFEKTSKISVTDIKDDKTIDKKVRSPYTMIPEKKDKKIPIIISICVVIGLILIIIVIFSINPKEKVITKELQVNKGEIYEFTYKTNSI